MDEGLAIVRLNHPEVLNAITFKTYEELERLWLEMGHDDSVKAAVLTGAGKGFCSGGSVTGIIEHLLTRDAKGLYEFTRMTCNVTQNMRRLKKPIIAAVNGIAAGAGAVLALACDLRVVSSAAKFSFLFVKVGLAGADMGAAYLLPRIVGLGRATELLFYGSPVDAEEAYRIGLANWVVPPEQVFDVAKEKARKLINEGPLYAIGKTKDLLNNEAPMDLETALETEALAQSFLMLTPEFHEGYKAFMEKRKPSFNR
ncbi:MAG TPA: enoyl-CoA hydratase-related protein [Methylomirabilota bacterium]|nr:enoyl-CoA hydratase-related protein [Methylomirabilota bacterium]